jgi:hypothetical protein
MPITLKDLLQHTIVPWGSLAQIPHTQGFYLVFDQIGKLIYVGKGYGDERVMTHFTPNKPEEYFDEARYWFWYQTNDECRAKAYERAIYDDTVNETGQPPSRNKVRPEGCGDSPYARLVDGEAVENWSSFLRGITIQRFVSKDLYPLLFLRDPER